MGFLFQGLLLGLAYVAPIGTQNMYVINTALTQERKAVALTAAIVTFFDITLAAACFFGIGSVFSSSKWLSIFIIAAGTLVVIWIGISLIRSETGKLEKAQREEFSLKKTVWNAFVVTWFNPQAIIDGSMLLGAYKTALPGSQGYLFIAGVCIASLCWWSMLSVCIKKLSLYVNEKLLKRINIICGAVIIVYGIRLGCSLYTYL